jgi:hypothetical protein
MQVLFEKKNRKFLSSKEEFWERGEKRNVGGDPKPGMSGVDVPGGGQGGLSM